MTSCKKVVPGTRSYESRTLPNGRVGMRVIDYRSVDGIIYSDIYYMAFDVGSGDHIAQANAKIKNWTS